MSGVQLPIQLLTSSQAEGKVLRTVLWGWGKHIGFVFADNSMLVIRLSLGYEDEIEQEVVAEIEDWSNTGLRVVEEGVVDRKTYDAAYNKYRRLQESQQKANDLAELQRLKDRYEGGK